jgi:hypothetical protein
VTAAEADAPPPAPDPTISPHRVWLVYVLAAVIVLGHLYEIVQQDEHWPFSPYPMYSALRRTKNLLDVQVVGVAAPDGTSGEREISFAGTGYLAPLPDVYLRTAAQQAVVAARKGDSKTRDAIATDVLKFYETRRSAKLHAGPPLVAVRIYELRWVVDANASNAKSPQRVLVSEARIGGSVPATRGAPR